MLRKLIIITILTAGVLLSPCVAFSQEPITAPQVLDSFAKIIRNKQYSCQKCNLVQPIGNQNKSRVYKASCKNDHSYEIYLTPHSDMVVKPLSEKLLVRW